MTDIVKFLRSAAAAEEEQFPILNDGYETADLLTNAADEIERLRARIARLEGLP